MCSEYKIINRLHTTTLIYDSAWLGMTTFYIHFVGQKESCVVMQHRTASRGDHKVTRYGAGVGHTNMYIAS